MLSDEARVAPKVRLVNSEPCARRHRHSELARQTLEAREAETGRMWSGSARAGGDESDDGDDGGEEIAADEDAQQQAAKQATVAHEPMEQDAMAGCDALAAVAQNDVSAQVHIVGNEPPHEQLQLH